MWLHYFTLLKGNYREFAINICQVPNSIRKIKLKVKKTKMINYIWGKKQLSFFFN